jgi:SAM-dependent methyltransferase
MKYMHMIHETGLQTQEWYRNWFNSRYYHILYADRNEQEAEDFINRLIIHLNPPIDARMLDIACGKGRHSIMLAKHAFSVTGIDISPISIQEACLSAHEKLEFYVHDMRLPFRINYYDYAFNFFTSFGYFDSLKEHQDALHNMSLSIKPGGIFVMDYLNPAYAIRHLEKTSIVNKESIHFNITRWSDKEYIYKKIAIDDSSEKQSLVFIEKVANFKLDDFTLMFKKNKLAIKEILGNYQLDPFDKASSPRMIMIAQKQEA